MSSFIETNVSDEGSTSSSSVISDCPTVRSASPKESVVTLNDVRSTMARSISGQLLDSDDEETASESCTTATRSSDCRTPVLPSVLAAAAASCMEDNHRTHCLLVPTVGSGFRSMSTPDLKNMDATSQTSYKAIAGGGSKDEESDDDNEDDSSSSESSSGWDSADELETNYQPIKLNSHRRPLRPAAAAVSTTRTTTSDQERKKKLRQKRERNRSNIVDDEANVRPKTTTTSNTSTYLRLNGNEDVPLSIPDQKSTGFHGGLAAEVASLALAMRNGKAEASELTFTSHEDVIGDDSGSDSSSSESEDSL